MVLVTISDQDCTTIGPTLAQDNFLFRERSNNALCSLFKSSRERRRRRRRRRVRGGWSVSQSSVWNLADRMHTHCKVGGKREFAGSSDEGKLLSKFEMKRKSFAELPSKWL